MASTPTQFKTHLSELWVWVINGSQYYIADTGSPSTMRCPIRGGGGSVMEGLGYERGSFTWTKGGNYREEWSIRE